MHGPTTAIKLLVLEFKFSNFLMVFFIISKEKKYLFNIRSYIDAKLIRLGIKNIEHIKMDTFSDKENFFSYRRSCLNNEKDYGRCISVILLT